MSCILLVLFAVGPTESSAEREARDMRRNRAYVRNENSPAARAERPVAVQDNNAADLELAARIIIANEFCNRVLGLLEESGENGGADAPAAAPANDDAPPPYTFGDGPLERTADGSARDSSVVPMQTNPLRFSREYGEQSNGTTGQVRAVRGTTHQISRGCVVCRSLQN